MASPFSESEWISRNAVPTDADWKEAADADQTLEGLDVAHAYRTCFGRTNQEMQQRFHESVHGTAEDLCYIPRIPFQYYILGFKDFVRAAVPPYAELSDAASWFFAIVLRKLQEQPLFILPVMPDLMPTIIHISENQQQYDADVDIYGDFRGKRDSIEALYRQLMNC